MDITGNSTSPTQQIYSDVESAYQWFNHRLFDSRLPNCILTFQRHPKTMGYVSANRWVNRSGTEKAHELAINPEYLIGSTIEEVFQTLVHEQCHIWQVCYGSPSRRGYHNREWAIKMADIGLVPSSTGKPGGKRTGERMSDYILAGGALDTAIQDLLASGFALEWLDRYTVYEELQPIHRFDNAGIRAPLSKKRLNLGQELLSPTSRMLRQKDNSSSKMHSAHASSSIPDQRAAFPSFKKKSTRQKYRCSCGNQIWGKPGLSINCGECHANFDEVV